jgi:NAD(P)-dependent dehydrogenase (short-subunit alcohol dehydrogenase family)
MHKLQHSPPAAASSSSSSSGFSLKGKVALVTGGTGTIGKAVSAALLSEGATVILTARHVDKLEEVRRSLLLLPPLMSSSEGMETNRGEEEQHTTEAAGPVGAPVTNADAASATAPHSSTTAATTITAAKVHVIPCDVSKEESVAELFREIDRLCIGLDLLVNNAGINVAGGTANLTATDMEAVLGVNVIGAFLCAREALSRFQQQQQQRLERGVSESSVIGGSSPGDARSGDTGGGRIINVGSLSAYRPRPDAVAYTTSKFALLGLTHSLALEGRPHGIAVGIIHPGNVVSDLLTPHDVEVRERTEGFLDPTEVARCVLSMAALPHSANVLEMTILPTRQPFVGRG